MDIDIIDIHIHIFKKIKGRNSDGVTRGLNYGRIKTSKGEIQFMPPYFKDTSFTSDTIVELMKFSNIKKGILLQNPMIGDVNDEIADAVKKYPDIFAGTIQVDPKAPGAVNLIKKYSANPRQNILKFEMSHGWGWSGIHKNLTVEDEYFTPIWSIASDKNLQVILDPGRPGNAGYQIEEIDRITDKYKDLIFVLEHLGGMNREKLHLKDNWLKMIRLGTKKNVYMGITSIGAGLREDFPCPQALGLLKEAVSIIGAEKLLWGSDLPSNLKFYTYNEMADMIIKYADFLSENEKKMIMSDNALKVFSGLSL